LVCNQKKLKLQLFKTTAMKLYSYLAISLLLIASQITAQQNISTFSPASGPIGTVVTINGTGFNAVPDSNVVVFGAVKASLLHASDSLLIVKVPLGATYKPITVTSAGLTAQSKKPFQINFSALHFINSSSFGDTIHLSDYGVQDIAIKDLDGDGKPDIATANDSYNNFSVYRNTSTPGSLSFEKGHDVFTGNIQLTSISADDLDGDNRPDLIAVDWNSGNGKRMSIYKNNSTTGNLSFASKIDLATNFSCSSHDVMDVDGDGRRDIVVCNNPDSPSVSIFRNTSVNGVISFASEVSFNGAYYGVRLTLRDMNDDGKPDLIMTGTNGLSIYWNTSTSGNISFSSKIIVDAFGGSSVIIADFNNDGKADIATVNQDSPLFSIGTIRIYRNTSAGAAVSFDTARTILSDFNVTDLVAEDVDGDGRLDITANNWVEPKAYVFKNTTAGNHISFEQVTFMNLGGNANAVGDLDMDGKPDWALGSIVARNKTAEPGVSPSGSNPVSGTVINHVHVDSVIHTYNGLPYVPRHYDIDPVNGAANNTATITLYFSQQDFNSFNAYTGHGLDLPKHPADSVGKSNLRVYQYHGFSTTSLPGSYTGNGLEINPTDSLIRWNSTNQVWEITFDITGFSGFFITSKGNNLLPLQLLSFAGKAEGKTAILTWVTSREVRTKSFDVERSLNGREFNKLGEVAAAGNSNHSRSYSFADALDEYTVYYYRLKMVDIDGKHAYSNIITMKRRKNAEFYLYPNPAKDRIVVKHPSAKSLTQIDIKDYVGRIVKTVQVPRDAVQTEINIKTLSPGIYQLTFLAGAEVYSMALVVE
jgi:hypothetical protein